MRRKSIFLCFSRYWSVTTLTLTQNQETKPVVKEDYIFISIQVIFALLLFATIMGHVASIVSNLSNARKDFQGRKIEKFSRLRYSFDSYLAKLDAVKTYMSLRRVPNNLEDRVIRWLVLFEFVLYT
jgi:cyclic nucleotide gated channel alpha 3